MEAYAKTIEIRWSDLDPNYHVKHSAYYDYGAFCRIAFLNDHGITPAVMHEHNIGPILLREECIFKKEIRFGDEISIDVRLAKARTDMTRWTMTHQLWKNKETLAAVITVDAAWIDTAIRKLAKPPEIFRAAFDQLVRTETFEYADKK